MKGVSQPGQGVFSHLLESLGGFVMAMHDLAIVEWQSDRIERERARFEIESPFGCCAASVLRLAAGRSEKENCDANYDQESQGQPEFSEVIQALPTLRRLARRQRRNWSGKRALNIFNWHDCLVLLLPFEAKLCQGLVA